MNNFIFRMNVYSGVMKGLHFSYVPFLFLILAFYAYTRMTSVSKSLEEVKLNTILN